MGVEILRNFGCKLARYFSEADWTSGSSSFTSASTETWVKKWFLRKRSASPVNSTSTLVNFRPGC